MLLFSDTAQLGDQQKVISQHKRLIIRGKCQDLVALCTFPLCIIAHGWQQLTWAWHRLRGTHPPRDRWHWLWKWRWRLWASCTWMHRDPRCHLRDACWVRLKAGAVVWNSLCKWFCDRDCSPLLQITLLSCDSYRCQGQLQLHSEVTVTPPATLNPNGHT